MYQRPIEIREQGNPDTVNIHRLVALALIAHKYKFTLLEKWSIEVLRIHWMADFTSKAVPVTPPIRWNADMIEQLVVLSTKTSSIDLVFTKAIEAQWLYHSITKTETPSGLQRTLEFADGLPSGRLSGLAYYHTLRRLGIFQEHPLQSRGDGLVIGPGTFQSYNNLGSMLSEFDPHYRLKLMRGFWCLMSLRGENSLRKVPIEHPRCISVWRKAYLDNSLDFGVALEVGLRQLQSPIRIGIGSLCNSCRGFLQSHFQTLLVAFEENLVSYFVPLE